jgi:NADP-dependent 3-hydroxy acid dehydrogenase YdfG
MSNLSDKVIVITGASTGIGAETARQLGARGASLALVARRADALNDVAASAGSAAHAIAADLTARAEVRRAVETTLARFGRIDVWVNNVGRGISRLPSQLTDEDIDEMVTVNIKAAVYGMQEVLPHFRERNSGHIVNISSMLGRLPYVVFRSAYSGSKHFLNALTANFRMEVQATHPGIQFSIVSPGVVRTEFGVNARHGGVDSRTLPESQSAEEVAAVIVDVIEHRRPDVYTRPGSRAKVIDYYSANGEDAATEG